MKVASSILLLLSITSCFKTAEQIKREQMVDNLDAEMKQSQELVAKLSAMNLDLQQKLAEFSGKMEELAFRQESLNKGDLQVIRDDIVKMDEQIQALLESDQKQDSQLAEISRSLDKQKKFIKSTTNILKKKVSSSNYPSARSAFLKGKYKIAKKLYEQVLSEESMSAGRKNRVYHDLGILEYKDNNYKQSMVYFSKIFSRWPKSSFAPNCLLYIGRNLKKLGKDKEAKASFKKLIKDYPQSKQVVEAKKELAL